MTPLVEPNIAMVGLVFISGTIAAFAVFTGIVALFDARRRGPNPLDDAYRMRAARHRYAATYESTDVPSFLRETAADRRMRYDRYRNAERRHDS